MPNYLEIWQLAASHLRNGENLMLLVVAESTGSSPGRAGYKMAVAANGGLYGSIGGGMMEVELVNRARTALSEPGAISPTHLIEQVHKKNAPNASGMICSGRQTVILKELTAKDLSTIETIITAVKENNGYLMMINKDSICAGPDFCGTTKLTPEYSRIKFERRDDDFLYSESLNKSEQLFIIGGGHCALALSELASKLDFRISIFDDRPELNTIAKNEFAASVTIIDSYENIGEHLPQGEDVYVVVMTLGFRSDAVVIRKLIDNEFKYFGVLGSKAKMATVIKELRGEGFDEAQLSRIHTPIGLPINSRTPEEIAVSIAAELIQIRNAQ